MKYTVQKNKGMVKRPRKCHWFQFLFVAIMLFMVTMSFFSYSRISSGAIEEKGRIVMNSISKVEETIPGIVNDVLNSPIVVGAEKRLISNAEQLGITAALNSQIVRESEEKLMEGANGIVGLLNTTFVRESEQKFVDAAESILNSSFVRKEEEIIKDTIAFAADKISTVLNSSFVRTEEHIIQEQIVSALNSSFVQASHERIVATAEQLSHAFDSSFVKASEDKIFATAIKLVTALNSTKFGGQDPIFREQLAIAMNSTFIHASEEKIMAAAEVFLHQLESAGFAHVSTADTDGMNEKNMEGMNNDINDAAAVVPVDAKQEKSGNKKKKNNKKNEKDPKKNDRKNEKDAKKDAKKGAKKDTKNDAKKQQSPSKRNGDKISYKDNELQKGISYAGVDDDKKDDDAVDGVEITTKHETDKNNQSEKKIAPKNSKGTKGVVAVRPISPTTTTTTTTTTSSAQHLNSSLIDVKFTGSLSKNGRPRLAYAITITKDGFFQDGAAVLAYSIVKYSQQTVFDISFIAFVHPGVQTSRPGLQQLGFHVIEVPVPVNTSAIRGTFLREHIDKNGCCGASELIKLSSYLLTQYHRVIHLDADAMLLNPIDELFSRNYSLIYSTDPNMATHKGEDKMPVQGGFIVMKPSVEDYHNLIDIIMNVEFYKGGGWNRTRIGWFWGGMTVQGVLPYYYNHVTRPGRRQIVDRCFYNTMADTEECQKQSVKELKSAHFTICQKPWNCYKAYVNRLCGDLHRSWYSLRAEAEKFYNMGVNDKPCPKVGMKNYQHMKLKKAKFPFADVPFVIPDDSPDCINPISAAGYRDTMCT